MSLADLQRRMARWITHPEGVAAALREEREGRDGPPLSAWVRGDERLAAEQRLDVYANAYFFRVLDVMAEEFPALRRALGADAFHDLVTSYLVAHPSRHPSIRWIGRALGDFLATGPLGAPFRRDFPWAADLARLEWALSLAFDAPEAEILTSEDLAVVPPEAWDELSLALVPAARRLDLDWPVAGVRRSWREADDEPAAGAVPPAIEAGPQALCVWRRGEIVHQRELEPLEAEALDAVAGGLRFGALCERIAARVGETEAPGLAAGLLARWLGEGLLAR